MTHIVVVDRRVQGVLRDMSLDEAWAIVEDLGLQGRARLRPAEGRVDGVLDMRDRVAMLASLARQIGSRLAVRA